MDFREPVLRCLGDGKPGREPFQILRNVHPAATGLFHGCRRIGYGIVVCGQAGALAAADLLRGFGRKFWDSLVGFCLTPNAEHSHGVYFRSFLADRQRQGFLSTPSV